MPSDLQAGHARGYFLPHSETKKSLWYFRYTELHQGEKRVKTRKMLHVLKQTHISPWMWLWGWAASVVLIKYLFEHLLRSLALHKGSAGNEKRLRCNFKLNGFLSSRGDYESIRRCPGGVGKHWPMGHLQPALFLNGAWATNGFYLFKWLKNKHSILWHEHYMKLKFQCPSVTFSWDTPPHSHMSCLWLLLCYGGQQSWTAVTEAIWGHKT